jgi:uncharacterized protein YndB with AHSA1/START domain
MKDSGALEITPHGEREIVMTRSFDAPRGRVFEALTVPDRLTRWLGVRGGWELAVCEVDLRVGGAYRFLWWHAGDGKDMGVRGVYREIVPPERLVYGESFDEPWYPGESVITHVLTEQGGRTTLTSTLLYESRATRDGVLESPMESGVSESYDKLAALLASGE